MDGAGVALPQRVHLQVGCVELRYPSVGTDNFRCLSVPQGSTAAAMHSAT